MDSARKRGNTYCQNQAVLFNSVNQMITNTITGDIMVLFLTDVLRFRTLDITFIISLLPLISIIRMPVIIFMRGKNYVAAIQTGIIIKMLFVTTIIFVPLDFLGVCRYSALLVIYQTAVEFGVGVCWQPLMREITTVYDRGVFFGRMRFIFMTVNSVYVFLISLFIKDSLSELQYKLLLCICLAGLMIQFYAICKMGKAREAAHQGEKKNRRSIKEQVISNKKILWPLLLDLVFLCAGVTLNVVYLKSALLYSSRLVSVYITIFNLSSTLMLPFMGRLADRDYKKGFSYICLIYVLYLMTLISLPRNSQVLFAAIWVIVYAVLSGIISSSVYLLMTILQHGSIKKSEDSFVILNFYQMFVYIATFLITNIMGQFLEWSEEMKLSFRMIDIDIFKAVNAMIIVCCILVVKLIVPKISIS